MKNISDFIIKPIISEKSYLEAKSNRYTFLITRDATKTNVKNAIERLFNVNVTKVFTANITGSKTRNTRAGRKVKDASYKKARVELRKGEKIDIFEEKAEDKKKK
ncbi:MAG: 50S ribosomal protein L23 [Candidatus Levybacteria bacterium RIFCSPHIGHO2_01_FULL_40_10]|nr:MAG: 50S ribosomal protein L23 [Candidatus Levybacteria bacterium RIFCSPHIGHO2_01_FULL_40_10]